MEKIIPLPVRVSVKKSKKGETVAMKYRDWLEEWLAESVQPHVKRSTYLKYGTIAMRRIAPRLGAYELEELTVAVLQRFAAELSAHYAPSTTWNTVAVLRSSLRRAQNTGVVDSQFSDSLELPRVREKRVTCFTRTEQARIERYILGERRYKLYGVLLSFYTGLRIGELLALEWADIDLARGILTVRRSCRDDWGQGLKKVVDTPKTETSERVIPIPHRLIPHLREYRRAVSGKGYFVKGRRDEVSIRSYQRTFKLLLERLRIPHRGFHAIRHTFATRALECGMDVKTLAEVLGHRDPTITLKRYAHSLIEHKSAMMDRLGKFLP